MYKFLCTLPPTVFLCLAFVHSRVPFARTPTRDHVTARSDSLRGCRQHQLRCTPAHHSSAAQIQLSRFASSGQPIASGVRTPSTGTEPLSSEPHSMHIGLTNTAIVVWRLADHHDCLCLSRWLCRKLMEPSCPRHPVPLYLTLHPSVHIWHDHWRRMCVH